MYCKVYCIVQAAIQTSFYWTGSAWLNIVYKQTNKHERGGPKKQMPCMDTNK